MLFFSQFAAAQLSIGPKVGVNFARIGGDDVNEDEINSLFGGQFGAVGQLRFNESFAIQPELLFFQKGYRAEFLILGEEFSFRQTLNYIEVPIMAKFMFFAQEGGQVYGLFGPSLGFGLNGKFGLNDSDETFTFEEVNFSKIDLSLTIGAGVQIPTGPGKLFLDVRYLLGLNTIDNEEPKLDIKNRGLGIGLGFLFPLGG